MPARPSSPSRRGPPRGGRPRMRPPQRSTLWTRWTGGLVLATACWLLWTAAQAQSPGLADVNPLVLEPLDADPDGLLDWQPPVATASAEPWSLPLAAEPLDANPADMAADMATDTAIAAAPPDPAPAVETGTPDTAPPPAAPAEAVAEAAPQPAAEAPPAQEAMAATPAATAPPTPAAAEAVATTTTVAPAAAAPATPATAPAAPADDRAYFASLGQGSVRLPVTSLRAGRTANTLIQQYDFSCGSAALATLLTHHYRQPTTEQEVFEFMYRTGDQERIRQQGFSLLDMKRYLAQFGMQADGFALDLDKLNEARTPAIVLINENGYQHFVVVKGLQHDRVLLGDPAQGTRALTRQQFDAVWPSRLLFVIHNRIGQGQFNLARDWRVAPRSPLAQGVNRDSLTAITLPKNGTGDF